MSPRRQRTYLAIMALGAAALFVDRFLLASGATAPAAAQAMGTLAIPVGDGTEAVVIPELPFPEGVRAFKFQDPIRDMFAPPGYRGSEADESAADNQNAKRRGGRERGHTASADFAAANHVEAILTNERIHIAIINGRWVRVGQSIDGCEVTEISGDRVLVDCGDGVAALTPGGASVPGGD